jgi:hypothetical protein
MQRNWEGLFFYFSDINNNKLTCDYNYWYNLTDKKTKENAELKKTIITSLICAMLLSVSGCFGGNGTAPVSSVPSTTSVLPNPSFFTISPSPLPSFTLRTPFPTTTLTLAPTKDPLVEMFQTPDAPGLKIGDSVISDDKAIYYVDKYSVYKIDKKTLNKKKLFNTRYDIAYLFLDSKSNIYISGTYGTQDIVKFDGKSLTTITKNAHVLKVDENYIYFKSISYYNITLKRYNVSNGEIEEINIPKSGTLSDIFIFQNKPLAFIVCDIDKSDTRIYLYNYITGSILKMDDQYNSYNIAIDEKSVALFDSDPWTLDQKPPIIYSLTNEFDFVTIQDFTVSDGFVCNGKEYQYTYNNSLFIVDILSDKIYHTCLISCGYDIGCEISFKINNGKWYILTHEPIDPNLIDTSVVSAAKTQPTLYSFDIQSHVLKCLKKLSLYSPDDLSPDGLSIDIDSGYLWIYNLTEYWQRFPLADLDK